MHRRVVVVLVVLGVVLGLVGPASPGGAYVPGVPIRYAPSVEVPVLSGRDVAVDPGTGRVFVAGDDVVSVVSSAGEAVKTITGMRHASGVQAAGGSVWVVVGFGDGDAVVRIDPVALTETGRWPLPDGSDPEGLAFAAGRIWTIADGGNIPKDSLFSIDPETDDVALELALGTRPFMARLHAVPGAPDLLVGAEYGGAMWVFDVSGETPEIVTQRSLGADLEIADMVVAPDGGSVLVADWDVVRQLALPSLQPMATTYAPEAGARALAVSSVPGGGLLYIGTWAYMDDWSDIQVFRLGDAKTVAQAVLPKIGTADAVPAALAVSSGGGRAYLLQSQDHDQATSRLGVWDVAPVVTTVQPRVVGTRGGGKVTVVGSNLAQTTVKVGGQATSAPTGSATSRTVTVPALPAGSTPLTVTDLLGLATTSPTPVVVRDLGPFRDSAGFADRQHQDFLGRAASASERTAADGSLAAGASVGALPVQLARSASFTERRGQVIRLYQAVYLRPPDTGGMDYWLAQLAAGRSLTWVASSFAAAPEFKTRYGSLTNAQFVDRIYQNVLGRPGEAAGRAYWTGELDKGKPRGTVVLGFSQSAEYRGQTANQVDVTNLYLGMLRRAPSASELSTALGTVTSTSIQAVAAGIVVSTEYRTRIG